MYSEHDDLTVGFPHSEIHGSKLAHSSPWLIAACHVLHRLSMPRHSPDALKTLDRSHYHHMPRQRVSHDDVCDQFATGSKTGDKIITFSFVRFTHNIRGDAVFRLLKGKRKEQWANPFLTMSNSTRNHPADLQSQVCRPISQSGRNIHPPLRVSSQNAENKFFFLQKICTTLKAPDFLYFAPLRPFFSRSCLTRSVHK